MYFLSHAICCSYTHKCSFPLSQRQAIFSTASSTYFTEGIVTHDYYIILYSWNIEYFQLCY